MQSSTGCKINVSPATGQDIERHIGLVGSQDSIERAKDAIVEKVRAVVRRESRPFIQVHGYSYSYLNSRTRIARVAAYIVASNSTTDDLKIVNSISSTASKTLRPRLANPIPMQPMVATRTMLLYGTLAFKQIKVNKTRTLKVLQAP